MLKLQQTIGNRAVQRLIESQFNRSPEDSSDTPEAGTMVNATLNTSGEALDAATRAFMESSFGSDFGGVRTHTDALAAESAAAIHAHAYTSGNDIVFAQGRYSPETPDGQRLLAHELTHVVQQGSGPVAGTPTADGSLSISDPEDTFEQAAEAQADRVVGNSTGEGISAGETAAHASGAGQGNNSGGTAVQREGDSALDIWKAVKEAASDGLKFGKGMAKAADSNATKTGFWGMNPDTGQPRSALDWGASLGTDYDKGHNDGNPSVIGGLLAGAGGIVGGIGGSVQALVNGPDLLGDL